MRTIKLPVLDNHGMGTVFEKLIRKFNEENNEEAGEQMTLAARRGKEVSIHLFGQEVQPETYAICKADMF